MKINFRLVHSFTKLIIIDRNPPVCFISCLLAEFWLILYDINIIIELKIFIWIISINYLRINNVN